MIDLERAARVVRTFKAHPILEDEPVADTIIRIDTKMPDFPGNSIGLASQREAFNAEADKVENALYNSLPGGLYDRLLGAMLRRKFIVSYGGSDE